VARGFINKGGFDRVKNYWRSIIEAKGVRDLKVYHGMKRRKELEWLQMGSRLQKNPWEEEGLDADLDAEENFKTKTGKRKELNHKISHRMSAEIS